MVYLCRWTCYYGFMLSQPFQNYVHENPNQAPNVDKPGRGEIVWLNPFPPPPLSLYLVTQAPPPTLGMSVAIPGTFYLPDGQMPL
jgi:hypothetical protein